MRESPVGLQAGVDPRKWARVLSRAHAAAFDRGHVPTIVRRVIADSWERCTATGLDPAGSGAPLVAERDDTRARWDEHPLSRATDVLRGVLGGLLLDAQHILVVSDADGCLLWSDGHSEVLRASERIGFTPGHAWSERAAGTNAVGTALAADEAVQVFSAEHYRPAVHAWQCSGAPIHEPETGALLGAIDITGRWNTASEHTLALVRSAARLVEERLRSDVLERDARILARFAESAAGRRVGLGADVAMAALSPSGRVLATTGPWGELVEGRSRLEVPAGGRGELRLLDGTVARREPLGEGSLIVATGRPRPGSAHWRLTRSGGGRGCLLTPGGEHRLTARHADLMALLAGRPDGLSAREVSSELYGDPGHAVAVRAELHRLREVLGPALATRPYRLVGVTVDVGGGMASADAAG